MNGAGKVLFVVYAAPISYSHGVAVLSAVLKQEGIGTDVFIANGNLDLFSRVLEEPWRAVCFAHCIKKDFDLSLPYVDMAIQRGHEVLMGGTYHRRDNPNKYDGVVKICRGDGERIVDYFLRGDDSVFTERLRTNDLDSLPMADYEIFEPYPYDGHIKHFPDYKKLPYTVSRGCIGKCKFCEVRHQEPGVRIRYSALDDIKYLSKRYGPELWFFTDELFPYHDKRFIEDFCNRMQYPYFAFIRADIEPNLLQAMIDCGLKGVAFGVESGDERYRNDVLGKGLLDSEIYRTVDVLKRNNTYFAHFYMIRTEKETSAIKLKTDKMAMSLGGVPMIFDFTRVLYNSRGC